MTLGVRTSEASTGTATDCAIAAVALNASTSTSRIASFIEKVSGTQHTPVLRNLWMV